MISSCNEDVIEIEVPKLCSENPELSFNSANLILQSEITSERPIIISLGGFIRCDSISIKHGDYEKLASVDGLICSDLRTSLNIRYLDTADNSNLKIDARDSLSLITGKIFYCPDKSNCTYLEIGRIMGWITDIFTGFYYSPLANGSFRIVPNYRSIQK